MALGVVLAVSSCKEDTYNIIDPNGVPQASDYNIKVDVDQTTNQVTLTLTDKDGNNAKGVYPVWKVYTKSNPVISTRPVYTDIVGAPGDYDVEMQVGNKNGISEGVKTTSFHIENTLADFSPYVKMFTDDGEKKWQIAANEAAHLACGEPGTDGTNWWSAQPYEKSDFGIYDNRMVFKNNGSTDGGLYTFDPGDSGTVYVNTGITDLSPFSDYWQDADYCVPVKAQEDVPFTFSVEGVDFFIIFPQGTLLAYLPNVDQYNNPKWKINSFSKNKIELTCSNNDIAWHYILQPEGADAGDKPFEGFKYDSEFNLWKNADVHLNSTWFADSGWGELANQPQVEVSNDLIKLHTPAEMGNDKWQGQVHIGTDIVLSAASTYDFSIFIKSNDDSKVTVKPHLDGDDGVFFTEDQVAFDAGGSYFYLSDVKGWDGPVVLTLDFAGNPDMDFEVSKVVIKDHANDDGTVLPSENPEGPGSETNVSWVDVNSDANIWNGATVTPGDTYTAADSSWSPGTEPTVTQNGNSYELYYPDGAGGDQWQAQFPLITDLSFSADQLYDFRVTIAPTCDIAGATVKPTDFSDQSFWSADRHALSAYEDNVIELVAVSAEMPDFKIVFDFAGVTPGATIVIKDIIIQEHQEAPAAPEWEDVNSDANIWNSGNVTEITTYTAADSSWSPGTDPEITAEGNSWTLYYPDGAGGDQWQAQFALVTDLSFPEADKLYDFRVTINPTCDIAGATVKPTDFSDGSFWSADRHALDAYEDNVIELFGVSAEMPDFKIVFDFAGVEAGAKIVVKDIIIQEHK